MRAVLFIFMGPFRQSGPIIEITPELAILALKWELLKLCCSAKTGPVDHAPCVFDSNMERFRGLEGVLGGF
jgi:hypothetical protein